MKNVLEIENNCPPEIYVACLAAYNRGVLHGQWIDATQDEMVIYEEIQKMLDESPVLGAEEWAILDYQGFCSLKIDQYESIRSVCEKARFIQKHGKLGAETIDHYGDIDTAIKALDDCYFGEWDSELEFAADLFDEIYINELPENLKSYIDYSSFGRDIFIVDFFSLNIENKFHVFSNY